MFSLISKIQQIGMECNDNNLTGYIQYARKQELYRIMWEAHQQLMNSPSFYGEEDWLDEHRRSPYFLEVESKKVV